MTSKRQQLPGYVRKQTKRGLWNVRRRSLSSQINCTMAHLKPHRGVTLWRITQQREERGGGHLMLLMSKLGARVKLRFATENMESPFFHFCCCFLRPERSEWWNPPCFLPAERQNQLACEAEQPFVSVCASERRRGREDVYRRSIFITSRT